MNRSYGMGLAIAWAIAEQHGGKIWAESGGGGKPFPDDAAHGQANAKFKATPHNTAAASAG